MARRGCASPLPPFGSAAAKALGESAPALSTGTAAGLAPARCLAATSLALARGFGGALRRIAAHSFEGVYVVGGSSSLQVLDTVTCLGPSSVWEALPPLPAPQVRCAVAAGGGSIYVVGGQGESAAASSAARAFDPHERRWRSLPDLPAPRCGCAAAVPGRALLALGGCGLDQEALASGDRLPLHPEEAAAWVAVPPMASPRMGCAAVGAGHCVVCLGGSNLGEAALRTAELLDPASGAWVPLPAMRAARALCAAAAAAGALLVAGGLGEHREVLASAERLFLGGAAAAWEPLPPLPGGPRYGCTAAVRAGALYVLGGSSGEGAILAVERFDPGSGAWAAAPPLPSGRFACAAAALRG